MDTARIMAGDFARDYSITEANRVLRREIEAFFEKREDTLPASPVCEYLHVVLARLAEDSSAIVWAWN